ncbi:MAG: D-glycero-beta-D-manno-heptose 1,7-bisphosphate 7-phosphatase [Betaproteobacteria bacterium]
MENPGQVGAPAAFLDRDGVINIDDGYVVRAEDFQFVPGVLEACAELARLGLRLVVTTNQSGIARGLYSEEDFQWLSEWMRERFAAAGAPLAGVYHCPHHPTEGRGVLRRACDCRKPAAGMLRAAIRDLGLDPTCSVMFGDKRSDMQAAFDAGVAQRVLLGTDGAALRDAAQDGGLATARYRSLADAVADPALRALLRR